MDKMNERVSNQFVGKRHRRISQGKDPKNFERNSQERPQNLGKQQRGRGPEYTIAQESKLGEREKCMAKEECTKKLMKKGRGDSQQERLRDKEERLKGRWKEKRKKKKEEQRNS